MQAHPEDLDQIVRFQLARPMSLEAYMRQLGACAVHMAGGTADRLNQIQSPTLVIHGEGDPLVPYPNGQFLARHIPGAKFMTLPETGHLATIEAADRLNARVLEFLS
jgi:pimeloyl-ACP methyl ester carboxylesterase